MTEPTVRVVRILVYEGTPDFIKSCLGEQRHVKGKISHGNGTITEGFLTGDVGNISFIDPIDAEEIGEEHKAKQAFAPTLLKSNWVEREEDLFPPEGATLRQLIEAEGHRIDFSRETGKYFCVKCGNTNLDGPCPRR